MNKYIAFLNGQVTQSRKVSAAKANASVSFASHLQEASDLDSAKTNGSRREDRILVGEIGRGHQTVSELLMQNKELKKSTWNILSSPVNRDKNYTQLVKGTKVYYSRVDGSLSWSSSGSGSVAKPSQVVKSQSVFPAVTAPVQFVEEPVSQTASSNSTELGVISRQNPTISHLLKAHSAFGNDTWNILSSPVNAGKDFRRIPLGTVVTIDPVTREINWQNSGKAVAVAAEETSLPTADPATVTTAEPVTITATSVQKRRVTGDDQVSDLTEAVRPYLGKKYNDINCYELLVKGLERMNIPYSGKNGLFSKLTRMAKEQGLPANAYLNGEGVVKAAGSLVLTKNYPHTANWKQDAENLYEEMEPLLDKGQILSFSTRRRGHTGIVSQQENQWTFINSGRLDNSLTKGSPRQGVGEENLRKEIRNWFKLAHNSGESLSVTLGTLGEGRVVAAYRGSQSTASPRRI